MYQIYEYLKTVHIQTYTSRIEMVVEFRRVRDGMCHFLQTQASTCSPGLAFPHFHRVPPLPR